MATDLQADRKPHHLAPIPSQIELKMSKSLTDIRPTPDNPYDTYADQKDDIVDAMHDSDKSLDLVRPKRSPRRRGSESRHDESSDGIELDHNNPLHTNSDGDHHGAAGSNITTTSFIQGYPPPLDPIIEVATPSSSQRTEDHPVPSQRTAESPDPSQQTTDHPGVSRHEVINNTQNMSSSDGTNNYHHLTEETSDEKWKEIYIKTLFEKSSEDVDSVDWNTAEELPMEEERHDVHEQPILMVIKFFVYILIFVVVLSAFVAQKVCFLLLTNGLKVEINQKDVLDSNLNQQQKSATIKLRQDLQIVFLFLLTISICIPYALTWVITVAKLCFGNFKSPSLWTWIWVMLMESLHSVGLCLLVFRILPNLDVFRSTMLLSATAILPAFLKVTMSSSEVTSPDNSQTPGLKGMKFSIDFIILLVQISVIPLTIFMDYFTNEYHGYKLLSEPWHIAEIVGTFVLVSFSHWENFTDGRLFCELGQNNWFKNAVLKIRFELQNGRHFPHMITYLWKIGLTLLLGYFLNEDVHFDYSKAMAALSQHKNPVGPKAITAAIVLVISAFLAFYVSFLACIFQMQVVSLTIPSLLAVPVTFGIFYLNSEFKFLNFLETDTEKEMEFFNNHLVFPGYSYNYFFGLAWWLSFVILSRHVWFPKVDRVANMARLFFNQTYCGILTCESVLLNRIRYPAVLNQFEKTCNLDTYTYYKLDVEVNEKDEAGKVIKDEPIQGWIPEDQPKDGASKRGESKNGQSIKSDAAGKPEKISVDRKPIPMLYACATMWHEKRKEMLQILKSIFRLDRDQNLRAVANRNVKGHDPDFYHFEAHIFFDDAFDYRSDNGNDITEINEYVKELVSCMDEACSSAYNTPFEVCNILKVPTPYGAQLIWQMPGTNRLYVHLKDIKKIRNKKRWSQVMYMFYLLSFRLNLNMRMKSFIEEIETYDLKDITKQAKNIFLLALDGDTDFTPGSVKVLLDRMTNEKVGAACGRIHPIGNGPVVWYQKFEYAIGHWLQKASEHIFGCVLCSPGCFSLFRASALLDTNVLKKYAKNPREPGEILQFDQGEDRYLCTLLLQQGHRIEYAAAADAYTFAPEGFFEFFNQRRRWMPSTIANLLDLLRSTTLVVKKNDNISRLYIVYQWLLMLMTILGPGTIIMMIAGAAKLVFGFSLVESYIFSTVPSALYIVICFWFSQKVQLIAAVILSVIYTFIMMVVLVGTIITATTEGIFHPSVVMISVLIIIFIISGLCHPQEVLCLMHGVLYLLTIPTGYLLLVIYSICNLNDVSWGTRDVETKEQRLAKEKDKKEKEIKKNEEKERKKNRPKKRCLTRLFDILQEYFGEFRKAQKDKKEKIVTNQDGDGLTSVVVEQSQTQQQASASASSKESKPTEVKTISDEELAKELKEYLKNPSWANQEVLREADVFKEADVVKSLTEASEVEIIFWVQVIKDYLEPIHPTEDEKTQVNKKLKDLRNSSTFALIIINMLWMALNFMFQLTSAAKFTISYGPGGSNKIEESALGMAFVFLLLLILVIQLFGMFFHRMATLQQLLAITKITLPKTQGGNTPGGQINRKTAIKFAKEVLKDQVAVDKTSETIELELATPEERKMGFTLKFGPGQGAAESRGHNCPSYDINRTGSAVNLDNTLEINIDQSPLVSESDQQRSNHQDVEMGRSFRLHESPNKRILLQGRRKSSTSSNHQDMEMGRSFRFQSRPNDWAITQGKQKNSLTSGALVRSYSQKSTIITKEFQDSSRILNDVSIVPLQRKDSITTEISLLQQ